MHVGVGVEMKIFFFIFSIFLLDLMLDIQVMCVILTKMLTVQFEDEFDIEMLTCILSVHFDGEFDAQF